MIDIKFRQDALYTMVFLPNYVNKFSFNGYAKSVSAKNPEGTFDVLPMHENFVTMITERLVIWDLENKKYEIELGKALLEATNNMVKVYVEF